MIAFVASIERLSLQTRNPNLPKPQLPSAMPLAGVGTVCGRSEEEASSASGQEQTWRALGCRGVEIYYFWGVPFL